jgi:hypothetical protein
MSNGLAHLYAEHVSGHECACKSCAEWLSEAVSLPVDEGAGWLCWVVWGVIFCGCCCQDCDRWLRLAAKRGTEDFAWRPSPRGVLV